MCFRPEEGGVSVADGGGLQHRPAVVDGGDAVSQGAPHHESAAGGGPPAEEPRTHHYVLEVPEAALALRRRQIWRALREPVELGVEVHLPRGEVLPRRVGCRRRAVDQSRECPRDGGAEPGIRSVDAPRWVRKDRRTFHKLRNLSGAPLKPEAN